MDIKVTRTIEQDGSLNFSIHVSNPHQAPFQELDLQVLRQLDAFKEVVQKTGDPDSNVTIQAVNALHSVGEKTFSRVRNNLVFAIQEEVQRRVSHICQEIYNWIYDNQNGDIKTWMQTFDPQRTKYYFYNDKTNDSNFDEI